MTKNKFFSVKLLLQDLDESEQQYNRNIKSHLYAIDQFVNIYESELSKLKTRFENDQAELINWNGNEHNKIMKMQNDDEVSIKTSILAMEQMYEEFLAVVKSSTMSK